MNSDARWSDLVSRYREQMLMIFDHGTFYTTPTLLFVINLHNNNGHGKRGTRMRSQVLDDKIASIQACHGKNPHTHTHCHLEKAVTLLTIRLICERFFAKCDMIPISGDGGRSNRILTRVETRVGTQMPPPAVFRRQQKNGDTQRHRF